MTKEFRVGDKVKLKDSDNFLGYVTYVFKGNLFRIDDFDIYIHLNGHNTIRYASDLEFFEND